MRLQKFSGCQVKLYDDSVQSSHNFCLMHFRYSLPIQRSFLMARPFTREPQWQSSSRYIGPDVCMSLLKWRLHHLVACPFNGGSASLHWGLCVPSIEAPSPCCLSFQWRLRVSSLEVVCPFNRGSVTLLLVLSMEALCPFNRDSITLLLVLSMEALCLFAGGSVSLCWRLCVPSIEAPSPRVSLQ